VRRTLIALSVLLSLATLASGGEWWESALSVAFLSIGVLVLVNLYRRFRRAAPCVPWVCHVSAAMAIAFGVTYVITGAAHSAAVVSLALKEPEFGPLQILRLTTGAMMLYAGAMNLVLYRPIRTGQQWAVAVSVATALLFWLYLLFLLPLPGAETVWRLLGPWSVYLLWLCAAAVANRRAPMERAPALAPTASPSELARSAS
jgi:hypothetical protein